MSAPETVKLTIDGVAVEVPKGTGLVEAALAAGIEIPVFCYEPRLGAPVGACRMCLCEITPGPPKPQAACTLQAADGMEVRGNADQLHQLVVILVDNALRYTPEGGRVTVDARRVDGSAVVAVSDTGIGIDPDALEHVFERFYRADEARTRAFGGSGLGLSIAEQLVTGHGGRIAAESTPGRGSTFTVSLPLGAG